MKTVTVEQFLAFGPCYSEDKIRKIADIKTEWNALDILALDIPSDDKLWAVLRPEFIREPLLHEFACRCAERSLALIDNPDPRSYVAIDAKRKWLRGEISDLELAAARDAARDAAWAAGAARDAAWDAAGDAAWDAARDAARAARAAWDAARAARAAARAAALDAAWDAAWAAWAAARAAARAARAAAWDAAGDAAWAAWDAQIEILIEMLNKAEEDNK